jgi:hypothetical protein
MESIEKEKIRQCPTNNIQDVLLERFKSNDNILGIIIFVTPENTVFEFTLREQDSTNTFFL